MLGDIISQKLIEKKEVLEKPRSLIVASYGFMETVIEGQYWLGLLERTVGKQVTLRNALLKTMLDMTIFGPFEIVMFIVWTNYLEKSKQSIWEKMRNDFFIVLFNSYIFWMPTSFLCFYVIPAKYRALYMCLISVTWDTYMSYAAHNPAVQILHRG